MLEQRNQTGSQGKSREGFFCGFPACPAECAVLWGLGSAHIPALLCSTSAPCSVLISGGSWRLKFPPSAGKEPAKSSAGLGGKGVCFAAPRFSLCLALQEWQQPLSAAPGLRERGLKMK